MPRNDGRVEKGQSLKTAISARAWNRAQDAADKILGASAALEAGETVPIAWASNVALLRNDAGENVPIFGVFAVAGVAIDPTGGDLSQTDEPAERAKEFIKRPVLAGGHPGVANMQSERIAIALEPIENQKVGRVAVGGMFPCKVYITSSAHGFAVPMLTNVPNNATHPGGSRWELHSADCGPVTLLWKENSTGTGKWALGVM